MSHREQAPVVRRISGEPRGPGEFAVVSATDPDHEWVVFWRNAHTHACLCPGFMPDKPCRHVRAVFDAIKAEWEALRATGALDRWPKKETMTV